MADPIEHAPAPEPQPEPAPEPQPEPAPEPPLAPPRARALFARLPQTLREWLSDPDFSVFFVAFMLVAAGLFLRIPSSIGAGFIFDEQEAILANPYVRGQQPWLDAFKRDFWGLLPDRSIGSYRPIPNLLWRALWRLQQLRSGSGPVNNVPFVWFNVVFHATNAALLATLVRTTTKRVGTAWLAGAIFCACAVLTEAITGIVGIADVLGGLSLLAALAALRAPTWAIAPAVFGATLFGLLSKESAVVNVGLVPLAALCLSRAMDAERPRPWARAATSFVGALGALAVYFVIRHHTYHVTFTPDPAKLEAGFVSAMVEKFRVYVGAPNLPVDPFNNPLAQPEATTAQRIAGALRVYFRGLVQVVAPNRLSPDYSYPQEPLPDRLIFPESVLGGLLLVGPPLVGAFMVLRARARGEGSRGWSSERALFGYALMAWPAAFFPISNIPKALPTVRAERFWYTPALATSVALALLLLWLAKRRWAIAAAAFGLFFGFQAVQARRHANDFRDDLAFWQSAAKAVPNSAKAHLNYSVMLGARAAEAWKWTSTQAQEARLVENIRAAELAPRWDMAHIYVGDTLCQLNRLDEAWEWYVKGFRLGPANTGLIALALQCMSDHGALLAKEAEALALIEEPGMPGSWLAYLVRDTLEREKKCRGVEPADEPIELEISDEAPAEPGSAAASVGSGSAVSSSWASGASASANAPIPGSGSVVPVASTEPAEAAGPAASEPKTALPPCGVDPKYRPRSLDGDPKAE